MYEIEKQEIKIIIADYDGTLRDYQTGTISPLTINEIQKAVQGGCYFIMNTGNLPYEMKKSVDLIVGEINDQTKYFIGCNGNGIKNFLTNETQILKTFNQKEILKIVEICEKNNFHHYDITSADLDEIYYKDLEYMNFMISIGHHPQDHLHRLPLTDEVLQKIGHSPKITLKLITQKQKEKIFQEIKTELPNLAIEYTWFMEDGVDLQPVGATKFTGIEQILKQINAETNSNLSLDNVVYFGDHHNDLTVFQNIKYAVAMGNATPEIKENAYQITTDAAVGGVGEYLQKIRKD